MEKTGLYIKADDLDGYFTKSVTVSIGTFAEHDSEIRYTLDGSVPDKTDKLYLRPFELTATTRVRAALFENGVEQPKWLVDSTFIRGPVATAQSFYATGFEPIMAIDGIGDWGSQWASKQYGGGTKQAPHDVWWAVKFPEAVKIKGVKKVGDDRDIIPLLKNFQIQIPDGDEWKTVHEVKGASSKTITILFDKVVETKGIRIYIPSKDLPRSENAVTDGIVRICELLLITLDDNEVFIREAVKLD